MTRATVPGVRAEDGARRSGPAERARPPVVLHLIHGLVAGGAETLTAELASHLGRHGWRAAVCAWRQGGPLEMRLAAAGVPTTVLSLPRRRLWLLPLAAWDILRIVVAVRQTVRRCRAAIIHAHLSDSAFIAVLAARSCGAKVVVTHHSAAPVPSGVRRGSLNWKFRRRLFAWSLARATRVIAVSSEVVDAVVELGAGRERVRLVINGVAFPPAPARSRVEVRAELGIDREAPLLICVGRLANGKGQRQLIEAMPALRRRLPAARLLLVGDGPERGALESLARLVAPGAVRFTGARFDVGDLLGASDAFATASGFEGKSLALLEALARGLPCVSAACPGNAELLAQGSGLLVAQEDPDALVDGLLRILRDDGLRQRLAAAGPDLVAGRYRFDRTVAETAAVYAEVADPEDAR